MFATMSNRSKKDVFAKEANDTLKRVLISPEYRSYMMETVTGEKPKNGNVSLEWSRSDTSYLEIEDEYNAKLAEHITHLRREMAVTVRGLHSQDGDERSIQKNQIIIPKDLFGEYLEQKQLLDMDLKQYVELSHICNSDERRIINEYMCSSLSIFQQMYGSPLPVKSYDAKDYHSLLEIYEKHQNEYNLAYPSFPEEYLWKESQISRVTTLCERNQSEEQNKKAELWKAIVLIVSQLIDAKALVSMKGNTLEEVDMMSIVVPAQHKELFWSKLTAYFDDKY